MAEIDAKSVFTNKQLKEEHKIIVDIKLKSKEN